MSECIHCGSPRDDDSCTCYRESAEAVWDTLESKYQDGFEAWFEDEWPEISSRP